MEAATEAPAERTAVLAFVDTVLMQDEIILNELGSSLLVFPLPFFISPIKTLVSSIDSTAPEFQPFPTTTAAPQRSVPTPPPSRTAAEADASGELPSIINFRDRRINDDTAGKQQQ